jgi:hypothetical protein
VPEQVELVVELAWLSALATLELAALFPSLLVHL